MEKRFRFLREWAEKKFYMTQASYRLATGPADQLAAESMFRLNRAAKAGWSENTTYQLKNHLVRIFYEKGYCTRVALAVQTLECWHTQGFLYGYDDTCPKCNGTGIYARHELYHFTFLIGGTRYTWHQPSRLVDWPVTLTDEVMVVYDAKEPETTEDGDWKLIEDQVVVYAYLLRAGVKGLPELYTLRKAVRDEWVGLRQGIRRWTYQRKRRLLRWARNRGGSLGKALDVLLDDSPDIPF